MDKYTKAVLTVITLSIKYRSASAPRGVRFLGSLSYSGFVKTRPSNSSDSRIVQTEPSFF